MLRSPRVRPSLRGLWPSAVQSFTRSRSGASSHFLRPVTPLHHEFCFVLCFETVASWQRCIDLQQVTITVTAKMCQCVCIFCREPEELHVHLQPVCHDVSTVTSRGSDISASNTTAETTGQEFTPNSYLMYTFSLHFIHQGVHTFQHLAVGTKPTSCNNTCCPSTPSTKRMSPSFIHDELTSEPLTQGPACNAQVWLTGTARDLNRRRACRIWLVQSCPQ